MELTIKVDTESKNDVDDLFAIANSLAQRLFVGNLMNSLDRDNLDCKIEVNVKEFKPNWKKAPQWANWWAMDCDKRAFWYEEKPNIDVLEWTAKQRNYGRHMKDSTKYCSEELPAWDRSLRARS